MDRTLSRRAFLIGLPTTAISLNLGSAAMAENCETSHLDDLRQQCLKILQDIRSTILTGRSLETKAWDKAREASKPSFECAKGGYDLGLALSKDCNPSSPGVNPAACLATLAGVPDTITSCKNAINLVQQAWSLYEQAAFIFGTADVAFSDQGGDDIANQLAKCGEPSCLTLGRAVSQYARENQERAKRNKDRLKAYENKLNEIQVGLDKCKDDAGSCLELQQPEFPHLEPVGSEPPSISLN